MREGVSTTKPARDADKPTGRVRPRTAAREPVAEAAATGRIGAFGPAGVLALQRTVGNAAIGRTLDEAEHAPNQRDAGSMPVQRSEQPAVRDVLRSPGRPLDEPVRTDMEARLGVDFSDVRIHTGSAAETSASAMGARAYTSGNHIVIGKGGADSHTLAHELTHVIQQRSGPVAGTDNGSGLKISNPDDRFERAAEANATRALAAPRPTQRAIDDETPAGRSLPGMPQESQRTAGDTAMPGPVQRMYATRPRTGNIYALPIHWEGPRYTQARHRWAGGRHSWATMGPQGYLASGGRANSRLPQAKSSAESAFPNESFVSGHLLNDHLGGAGHDPDNLTILTGSANNQHHGFDDRIKDALRILWNVYSKMSDLRIRTSDVEYGIKVSIRTSEETWGYTYPANCIPWGIHNEARVIGESNVIDALNGVMRRHPGERLIGRKCNDVNSLLGRVRDYVAMANRTHELDNSPRRGKTYRILQHHYWYPSDSESDSSVSY